MRPKIDIHIKTAGQSPLKLAKDKPQEYVYYWHRIIPAAMLLLAVIVGLVFGIGHLLGRHDENVPPKPATPVATVAPKSAPVPAAISPAPEPIAQRPAPATVAPSAPSAPSQSTRQPEPTTQATPAKPSRQAEATGEIAAAVRGMQLTKGQVDGEPVGPIEGPIPMNRQGLVKVFLFTELSGLQGQVVYHDWYWKDRLIAHARVPVHRAEQRSFTSKFIDRIMVGPWHVQVVDEKKQVLGDLKFEVRK